MNAQTLKFTSYNPCIRYEGMRTRYDNVTTVPIKKFILPGDSL